MDELWCPIPDFSMYNVSSLGRIEKNSNGRLMRPSKTLQGLVKISLIGDDGVRHSLSIAALVAEIFVERPNHYFSQVVLLDGNQENLAASNMVWRPPSFAWHYVRQLRCRQPLFYRNVPVMNLNTGDEYDSVVHCGMTEGVLFDDVWSSMYKGTEVFPYGFTYKSIDRV